MDLFERSNPSVHQILLEGAEGEDCFRLLFRFGPKDRNRVTRYTVEERGPRDWSSKLPGLFQVKSCPFSSRVCREQRSYDQGKRGP